LSAVSALPCFVSEEAALSAVLFGLKLAPCPHCRRTGALNGHGLLRGYAEGDSAVVVRGRRVFCSNRARRPGCGGTFSVKLSTVLAGFLVRTLTLWLFASAVVSGVTRRGAWLGATRATGAKLSLSSGYRLWRRLSGAQSALRVRLWREAPAPWSAAHEPLAELLAHVSTVVGTGERDALGALQVRVQQGVFEH
jgi:hypothetical protein